MDRNSIRTVIIPAAGQGTRLLPATKVTAKELLPVYDRVAIDFAMEEAVGAGAERIVVVISPVKETIRSYLSPAGVQPTAAAASGGATASGPEICFVIQEQALGLGHAVLCCRQMVLPGPFAVLLPDDIIMGPNCLKDMSKHYTGGHMIAAMEVAAHETSNYGIFKLSGPPEKRRIPISGMVEKPAAGMAPSNLAAVGRYILDAKILAALERTTVGSGGELQLTDAIAAAIETTPVTAFRFAGTRHDCGTRDGLLAAALARQAIVRQKGAKRVTRAAGGGQGFGPAGVGPRLAELSARPLWTEAGGQ